MASAASSNTLEKKLGKVLGGYQARSKALRKKVVDTAEALEKARIELDAARTRQQAEEAGIANRLEKLRGELGYIGRREREAQEEYRRSRDELDSLGGAKTNGYH
jgi:pre-mRNA-splicing factor CDC5/CEF1